MKLVEGEGPVVSAGERRVGASLKRHHSSLSAAVMV
jgi:hypothetical protein